jgi:hypothetical protein
VGEEGLFKGGCPVCGYSSDPRQGKAGESTEAPSRELGNLPLWVYILTGSILLAVCGLLFFTLI